MTFMRALQWMSESEDNLCEYDGITYKIVNGKLKREFNKGCWLPAERAINFYLSKEWRKLIKKKKITFYETLIERVSGAKELIWVDTKDPYRDYAYTGNTKEIEIDEDE